MIAFINNGTANGSYTSSIAKTLSLTAGTYSVSFYVQARFIYYNMAHTISATLNGTSTTAYSLTSFGTWIQQSLTTTIATSGSYTLIFTSSLTATGYIDSSILLGGISVNSITSTGTPLSLSILMNNYTGTSSTVVLQRLNTDSNSYEAIGNATSTGTANEFAVSLTDNSDYQLLNSSENVNGIGGGDPHFLPLFGSNYTFCNDIGVFRLFESSLQTSKLTEKLIINARMWKLPENLIRRSTTKNKEYLYNYSFIKYVSIIFIKDNITDTAIIDMDTLNFCEYTNIIDEENYNLKELSYEPNYNYLNYDNITTAVKNLYKIPLSKFCEDNCNTMDRNFTLTTIKYGIINIELVIDPCDHLDRNHVYINVERDCTENNCFGLLVKEGQIKQLNSIIDL